MNRSGLAVLGVGAALLSACSGSGPSNFKVHEVALYGATQEQVVWVYGALNGQASSSVKLGGQTLTLRPQQEQGTLALPGTLSVAVQGKAPEATYRTPLPSMPRPLDITRSSDGSFNVVPLNRTALTALYYTDGTTWTKLSAAAGRVRGEASAGLRGAGQLTDAEAEALGRVLARSGPMTVAVLSALSEGISAEPKPTEYLQTSLYVLPGTLSPAHETSGKPQGGQMNFTEVAHGSNAASSSPQVRVATTPEQVRALYTLAYGRQSTVPAPVLPDAGHSLVGVFLGERNSGGYSIQVVGSELSGSTLTLRVRTGAPKPGMMTMQALTSPWTMVSVLGKPSQVKVVDESGQVQFP